MSDIGKSKKSLKKKRRIEKKRQKIKESNNFLKNSYLKKIYSRMEFLGEYYKNIRTDTEKKEEERGTIYNYLSMAFFNNGLGFQYYEINKISKSIKDLRLDTDNYLKNIKENKSKENIENNIQKIEDNTQKIEDNIQEIENILNIKEINDKIGIFINEKNIEYAKYEIKKIKDNISDIKSFIQNTKKVDIDKVIKKIKDQFIRIETNFNITVHHLLGNRDLNSPESTITFADNIHKKLHARATSFMQDLDKFDNKIILKKLKNNIEMVYKDIENLKKENNKEINEIKQILNGNTEEIENLTNKINSLSAEIKKNDDEIKKLDNEIKKNDDEMKKLDDKIKEYEEKNNKKEINKLEKEIDEFIKEIFESNKDYNELDNNIINIINEDYEKIYELKKDINGIVSLKNKLNKTFMEKGRIYKIKFEKGIKKKELENKNKKNSELKLKLENKLNEYNKLNDENLDKKEKENIRKELNKKIEELNNNNIDLKTFNIYNEIYNILKNINNFSNISNVMHNIKNELKNCKNYKYNKKFKNKYKNICNEFDNFNKNTDNFIESYFTYNSMQSFNDFKNNIEKLIKIEERMITEIENNQIKVLEKINSLEEDELLEKTMEKIYNFKGKFEKKFKDTLIEKMNKDKYKCKFQEENGVNNIVEFSNDQKLESLYEKIKNNDFSEEDYLTNANDSEDLNKRISQLKKIIYIAKITEEKDKTLKAKANVADFIKSENKKIIDGNNKYIAEAKERINSLKDISKCIDNIEQIENSRQRF